MTELTLPYIPLDTYLQHEASALLKSEYFNGAVWRWVVIRFSMILYICNQLVAALLHYLIEKDCSIVSKDVILYIDEPQHARHPDVFIICGKPKYIKRNRGAVAYTNPCVIMEVLSEGTEKVDRGKKYEDYKSIPSLHTYILIHQEQVRAEVFSKNQEGSWPEEPEILEEILDVLGCEVPLPNLHKKPKGLS